MVDVLATAGLSIDKVEKAAFEVDRGFFCAVHGFDLKLGNLLFSLEVSVCSAGFVSKDFGS